jgi:DNA polymerase III subunit epsilon
MGSFVVIDVETANPDLESICQIGVVRFAPDGTCSRWKSLVNPEDYFDPINVGIHGIDELMVSGAPTFREVHDTLVQILDGMVVVSHTHFDRVALQRACQGCDLRLVDCTWLDSARVVRRAWPDHFARSGYGLSNVASYLGIGYRAHDAEEDAWAAGMILLRAIQETGLSLQDWLARVRQPIRDFDVAAEQPPNPEGPLYGEVICFTGALAIPRRDAAHMAAAAGCFIGDGVTKETTLLVVGDQDVRKLAGHKMSSKHRKAEQLISKGQPLRILSERDFQSIVQTAAT